MSGPRFLLSGVLVLACLTAFVLAFTATQASGSTSRPATAPRASATAHLSSSTDLSPWLAPAGFAVMLAGIAVVGTARRRTDTLP